MKPSNSQTPVALQSAWNDFEIALAGLRWPRASEGSKVALCRWA